MARRQDGIVIVAAPVARISPIGRKRDHHVAERRGAETKSAIAEIRIVFGRPPGRAHRLADSVRQAGELSHVVVQGKCRLACPVVESLEQLSHVRGNRTNGVACVPKVRKSRKDACRNVETYGVSRSAAGARIVGKDDGDLSLRARGCPEADEGRDLVGRGLDPIRLGTVHESGKAECFVLLLCVLETERSDQHPPVELGQHHVHGKVRGAEAAGIGGPGFTARIGNDGLQHRSIATVEHAVACGEGGGGDDDRRCQPFECAAHERDGLGVLQTRNE